MQNNTLREKLSSEMLEVDAAALLPHHRRGGLVVAAVDVDLLDAAVAVAGDDAERIRAMMERGQLTKPTLADMANWCMDKGLLFRFVIVQPYVLAQPLMQ